MNTQFDVIVIGGGTAGVTAATTARRHYPDKKVLLIRQEEKTLIPCGIPYMFGSLKHDPLKNVNPDYVLEKRGIELHIGRVAGIDRAAREVRMASGEVFTYSRLVLATGSEPVLPPIPGMDRKNVFWINKNLSYLREVLAALDSAKRVLIVGGGFVGVELAEEIRRHRGLEVTIVEILPSCLFTSFDEELCIEAEQELAAIGVTVHTGKKVMEFVGDEWVRGAWLEDGTGLPADLVLVTTGVRPVVSLAQEAGLALGPLGGILTDRTMATSDPYIFACGDCTEKFSFFAAKPVRIRLASVAGMEARVAGANLFARRRTNPGTVGVFSTKIGNRAFGCAGLTEQAAQERGYELLIGEASAPDRHPSVLPGTQQMQVKLVFDRYTGTLLGGQAVGGESTGELVNLLSACVLHRMTATQIAAFQMGTHPLLTPAPAAYPLAVAAESAAVQLL